MEGVNFFSCCLFIFMASASLAHAHIAEFDKYWQKRAELAHEQSRAAYNPDPEAVTASFNEEVHRALESNSTRRQLRGRHLTPGKCVATNPIDRCWRCRKNWAHRRKMLATCVKGFGHRTTGGAAGRLYVVTDPSDNNLMNPRPGTLRHAVIQAEPLWIVFSRDMVIRLSQELIMNSNKTIDARGFNIRIAYGAGITIQYVQNIIIHNLHIHNITAGTGGLIRDSPTHYGLRTRSDGDGISIFGASNIWIDHVSMSSCSDGLIDAIEGSTGITISNSHFTYHDEVMLFGASDSYSDDQRMQITVAFNHFGRGLIQRMPRARWGFVHVVNNDYTHWQMYAVGGSEHPTIVSQGNRFIAPDNPWAKEVTKRDYAPEDIWKQWAWTSEKDLLMNGAIFVESGGQSTRKFSRQQLIKMKPGKYVKRLTRFSGSLDCKAGQQC